jgi:hypothetical protein
MLFDIGDNWSVIGENSNGHCNLIETRMGSICLQTGLQQVWGARWDERGRRHEIGDATHAERCTTCGGIQFADVYHITLPGEERKPYSLMVAKQFDQAGVVDWSTHSFKTNTLNVTQNIIAWHGNGLDEA